LAQIKPVHEALTDIAALDTHWLELMAFAAAYYQRSVGEFALGSLPPSLRDLSRKQLLRKLDKRAKAAAVPAPHHPDALLPELTAEQHQVLQQLATGSGTFLLHGNTGSGKTEVYLRRAAQVMAMDPQAQVMMLVPEINLTPQLEERVRQRFAALGDQAIVSMHSGMTPAQRLNSWLSAHTGQARLVLGTRLAVLA
jgi:primosomal protein N' (replication factor Y)